MGLIALILAVLAGVISLGVWLVASGVRGRRVDQHPLCGRCRFDLVGTVKNVAAVPAGMKCPECGRDLSGVRAIRIGNRAKRPGRIAGGAGLLLLVLGGAGVGAWAAYSAANPNVWKPNWWLVAEARWLPAQWDTQRFASEAATRVAAGKLGVDDIRALARRALDVQRDTGTAWHGEWGDVIEAARSKGLVDDAAWKGYLARAVDGLSVRLREPGVSGEPAWPVEFERAASRAGTGFQMIATVRPEGITIDGVETAWPEGQIAASVLSARSVSRTVFQIACTAEPGERTAVVRGRLDVRDGFGGPVLYAAPFEQTVRVRVVPPGTRVVEVVDDEAVAAVMSTGVTMGRGRPPLVIRRESPSTSGGGSKFSADWALDIASLPVPTGGRLVARTRSGDGRGDREWRVGTLITPADAPTSINSGGPVEGWDPEVRMVDLVIVPDVKVAEGAIGIDRIWGREIVIKNVAVVGPGPGLGPPPGDGEGKKPSGRME
jgi:hypothetical protein